MDDYMTHLNKCCMSLGEGLAKNNSYQSKDWDAYHDYLETLIAVWKEVMLMKSKLGLSIITK